ncbi:MAG: LexA family transcriptional regulator [Campylobacteraceae bacterium]|jgi:phage repressor protein C with HTH and peptisase S24 domain|nr:LexA family transcriptional regulator [Campylobacteraceae bacterium]
MDRVAKIINKRMIDMGIRQRDLITYLGESQSAVSKWISLNPKHRNDMPNTALLKICTYLDISPYYLLGLDEPDKIRASEENRRLGILDITTISHRASAGTSSDIEGVEVADDIETMSISSSYFKTPQKAENLRVMQVDGYSMTPMLYPDSHIIFDITKTAYAGDGLYIVNFKNILMAKLLQVTSKGTLKIISTNKEYESYEVEIDNQSVFKIVGKVVKIIM